MTIFPKIDYQLVIMSVYSFEKLKVLFFLRVLLFYKFKSKWTIGLFRLIYLGILVYSIRFIQFFNLLKLNPLHRNRLPQCFRLLFETGTFEISSFSFYAVFVAVESYLEGPILQDDITSGYTYVESPLTTKLSYSGDEVFTCFEFDTLEVLVYILFQKLLIIKLYQIRPTSRYYQI